MSHDTIDLDAPSVSERAVFVLYPEGFDAFLSPHLAPGRLSVVHSTSRAALALLAHLTAVRCACAGHLSAYLDPGSSFNVNLVRSLCHEGCSHELVLSRILVAQVLSVADLYDAVDNLTRLDGVSLVVIESLSTILNLSTTLSTAERQRLLFRVMERLRRLVNERDLHVMMTVSSSRNWIHGGLSPVGGNVLAHAVDTILVMEQMRQDEPLLRVELEKPPSEGSLLLQMTRHGFEILRGA